MLARLLAAASMIAAARDLRRARVARRRGRYLDAARAMERALRTRGDDAGLHIQCGHMYKEARRYPAALRHYRAAERLRPDDADLHLQLGHFLKITGEPLLAERAYRRAIALDPDIPGAREECERLARTGFGAIDGRARAVPAPTAAGNGLAPELAPGAVPPRPPVVDGRVHMFRFGRRELGDGTGLRTVRGVTALRGYLLSTDQVERVELVLNGITVVTQPPSMGARGADPGGVRKHVFNIWVDLSRVWPGRHQLEIRLTGAGRTLGAHHETVHVGEPAAEGESDAVVALADGPPRRVDAEVMALPSMVRPAARASPLGEVRAILVQRTDQLGDLIASLPAVRRLRELFPRAMLVGLLTEANASLARRLALFDDVVVVDFPDCPAERRRVMPLPEQELLRQRLRPYAFDLALDLATSAVSRPLLWLAGARHTLGVGSGANLWLSLGFDFNSHDPANGLDFVPHAAKVLTMVEALGALVSPTAVTIPLEAGSRAALPALGIAAGERYVLIHTGARIGFSRYPHVDRVAERLLARHGVTVVMLAQEAEFGHVRVPMAAHFILIREHLPFAAFDALVGNATVVVGNDSGPKHLAALRGVPVVTLFSARINWQEWGQEGVGTVISRKVPCAGCATFHDTEDCGKDFACIAGIAPDEVVAAVAAYL